MSSKSALIGPTRNLTSAEYDGVAADEISAPVPPPITAPHSSSSHHCRSLPRSLALSIVRTYQQRRSDNAENPGGIAGARGVRLGGVSGVDSTPRPRQAAARAARSAAPADGQPGDRRLQRGGGDRG